MSRKNESRRQVACLVAQIFAVAVVAVAAVVQMQKENTLNESQVMRLQGWGLECMQPDNQGTAAAVYGSL